MQPTLQDNQLMSKHRVLSFKPQLRLEGEATTARTKQSSRSFRQLMRFHHAINSDKAFGTHTLRKAEQTYALFESQSTGKGVLLIAGAFQFCFANRGKSGYWLR